MSHKYVIERREMKKDKNNLVPIDKDKGEKVEVIAVATIAPEVNPDNFSDIGELKKEIKKTGTSHIAVDDHCYVLYNNGGISSHMFKEAIQVIKNLPLNPDDAK